MYIKFGLIYIISPQNETINDNRSSPLIFYFSMQAPIIGAIKGPIKSTTTNVEYLSSWAANITFIEFIVAIVVLNVRRADTFLHIFRD